VQLFAQSPLEWPAWSGIWRNANSMHPTQNLPGGDIINFTVGNGFHLQNLKYSGLT
jgi:hypothetical protein